MALIEKKEKNKVIFNILEAFSFLTYSRKRQLINKLADELETGLSEILDINQRLKFDIEQEEDTIKIGNDRIKRMRDMYKEKNELEHKLAITTKAAESSGYLINRDENGKPIFDETTGKQLSTTYEASVPFRTEIINYEKNICKRDFCRDQLHILLDPF